MPIRDPEQIRAALELAVERARRNRHGAPATYIDELANVPLESTSAAVTLCDGTLLLAGDAAAHRFTFQSSAKLLTLAALLEERGPVEVFGVVGSEPSGDNFASVARLETHGPIPANPLINSGAIALCGLRHVQRIRQLPGSHRDAGEKRSQRCDRRGRAGRRRHCGV
jgi:glutaminase